MNLRLANHIWPVHGKHGAHSHQWTLRLLFEPRDLWIGVFWDTKRVIGWDELAIYICLVPCLPLKFEFHRYFKAVPASKRGT